MKASLLLVPAAVLTGCATLGLGDAERSITYACNYGPNLTITYAGAEARIESEDGMVSLRQRPSAAGFWYESATHSLRGSRQQITYVDRQMAPRQCRAV